MKILIVDDRKENLLALEAVLKSPDYHLVFASSGEEALRCLLKDDFAVILLDVQMPGMDGFETAKLIRARKKNEDTPIIFITAIYHSSENITQGYSLGAIDYLFKPFNPEMLKFKIEAFVKIHLHKNKVRKQNELLKQHALKLESMNKSLERTTSDLRKAEALAGVIGETSINSVITLDAWGNVINSNPAVLEMFGYEHGELLGKHVSVLFAEECSYLPNLKNSPIICERSKIPEAAAKHKNGRIFPAEIQIGLASLEDQQIFVWSVRDITERKQLEKERIDRYKTLETLVFERTSELFQTNEKLKKEIFERKKIAKQLRETSLKLTNILESITDVFFTLDHQWRFIFVNEEAEKYWLKGRDELIGNNIWDLFPEARSEYYLFNKALKNTEAAHFEIRGYHTDVPYEVHAYPSEEGLSVYYHNIFERRMFEKEMARLDRLNLVGQMAAGIGHEIRNPLTTVKGFLQLLGGKEEFRQSKGYFELMIEELDRANSIITEFLSLAKNKTVDLKPLILNELIENLFPLIQADAMVSDKEIKLQLQDVETLPLNEKEIRQLILNLVRNGVEAMSKGGALTIRTFMEGEEIVMAVQDEGCGIKDEDLEKVGTPFFTTKENGTGLGLATCFSIAARHNAKIDIDTGSTGTTFFVRFKTPTEKSVQRVEEGVMKTG
ncbi:PAS domain S-box [Desulfosporosinus orientis DSM 765]|uniref:Stage 0 sporulation protein A homolog n=1 Tax=Desulfosporosinus orientis (strain ATCC 19365 / DSM 765 / NCIMB 8382 / VKM B-1628 / Singapore I) TaxID=768706 RepID=G7W579_DESOD|nr:response regulator [Desulfosporosinus orientis]AET66095.1 PAS domain S-box [Desulfosporosinus orientis DSM 765]